MIKRKLFVLGSCLLIDIITENKDIFNKYFDLGSTDWNQHRMMTTTISLLNSSPGAIASRLQDEMHVTVQKGHGIDYKQYNSIVKPINLTDFLQQVSPGDVLLIDFHGDMYPTYDNGLEKFEIHPGWNRNKMKYPNWLIQVIESFPTYQADMISSEQGAIKRRDTKIVTEVLSRVFGSNIIAIGSVHTNKQYLKELNSVGEALSLSDYNVHIPFIKIDANGNENHINFKFFSRIYDSFDKATRHLHPDWTHIVPDKSMCFSDPDHRYGIHPCHLHPLSMNQFRKPLEDALVKLCNPSSGSIII